MTRIVNLAAHRRARTPIAETEACNFRELVAAIRAGVDVRANLEQLEGIELHSLDAERREQCRLIRAEAANGYSFSGGTRTGVFVIRSALSRRSS